ncbi:hypothetical protein D3C81_1566800 [compost metagenome]
MPVFTASQVRPNTPTVLPSSKPMAIPIGTKWVKLSTVTPASGRPALANANSGRMPYATHGCSACSRPNSGDGSAFLVRNGMQKARVTPASVAWTPLLSTQTHRIRPMIMYGPSLTTPRRFIATSAAIQAAASINDSVERAPE